MNSADETYASTLSQLEAALIANNLHVPDGAVQRLLDEKKWIYRSQRVEELQKKLDERQLYSVFNSQHHIDSASRLFKFLEYQGSCVVFGHKSQGKTQFLFFVFKLLQALGEKALFLDRTVLPSAFNNKIDIYNENFCGNLWKDSFSQIGDGVNDTLEKFRQDPLPQLFGNFLFALQQHTRNSKSRVWIIVDEVALFEKFPIQLPEEQDLGSFKWIVTGSVGIGSWVAKRHLQKFVFDLPLFTKAECSDFAHILCNSLGINLENGIGGVPLAGIDDWLEERFGGVIGYISEMFLELSNGSYVSQFMSGLSDRIDDIIRDSAVSEHVSNEQHAKDWLRQIKSARNGWKCLCDAGLCGSSPPRGVIFSLILEWLCIYSPEEDALSLVSLFRSKFLGDPGLDGCLLEVEEILKLKANTSLEATLLMPSDEEWIIENSVDLPSKRVILNIMSYDESRGKLERNHFLIISPWCLIQIPYGFDVIDVVLVNVSSFPAIYGIQITRSVNPFATHHTFDTCPPRSKERLQKLWIVICNHFGLVDSAEKFYVMLAPNCKGGDLRPPSGHSSNFYFSPKVTEFTSPLKKRRTK